jgi:A/G-specific adenine glycosylase
MRLTTKQITHFQRTVYSNYERVGRSDLPWRRTRDPYRILVSEVMLQQTQVQRVGERYEAFLRLFPDFASLARAPLAGVLAAWSGLGYNRRALYLRRAAQIVVSEYNGRLPRALDELLCLPGVGRATAAAVAVFAFGRAHPFIETNIRTVFIHEFFAGGERVADADIMPLVEQTIDRADPRRWFHALMDYGVWLKKTYPNPSRRSAHHTTQGRFAGSDREARGLVIKALARRRLGERDLRRITGVPLGRLRSILARLIKEGLVARRDLEYSIAE